MVIQSEKSKKYCRAVNLMMDRYSKNTVLKAVDLINSHGQKGKIYPLVEQNLPEEEFLRELTAIEKTIASD